jgi:hypothetical protein
MNETQAYANGVKLPEMSIKPYVEYGVGVQKQVGDRFTGYAQAMLRNGGRNGIALTGGFRWALGKDANDRAKEKVQNNQKPKKNNEIPVKELKNKNNIKQTNKNTQTEAGTSTRKVLKSLSGTRASMNGIIE